MAHQITKDCIGCTLCARNCPVGAISGVVKTQHSINEKRCVDCGVCGRICAKGAVLDAAGSVVARVSKEQWKKPVVDEKQCSACSMCVDACTVGCLQISYPKCKGDVQVYAQLVNPERCIGCGLCERACPLHAIKLEGAAAR